MATIADVARAANVSVSTVSYALSGRRPISEETKRRVFAAMDEMGYRPHAHARALASRRSRIIALLFPIPERGLGYTELEFVTSAADAAMARGYQLILWPSDMHEPETLRNLIQQSLVDGVVVMEVRQRDSRIAALRDMNMPFTMIGRCADNTGLDFVDIDFETTTDDAVSYLVNLGHQAIGFISHSQSEFESGYGPTVRCIEAFVRATARKEVHSAFRLCDSSATAGAHAAGALRAELPEMTALLIMNDRAIAGILQILDQWGASVPNDISLVSLGSSARVGEMYRPPITAWVPPSFELARLGVNTLIDKLEGARQSRRQVLISCQLVEQGSAARPRRAALPSQATARSAGQA